MKILVVNSVKKSFNRLMNILEELDYEVDEISNMNEINGLSISENVHILVEKNDSISHNLFNHQSLVATCIIQNGKFRQINKKFLSLLGYEEDNIIPEKSFFEVIAPRSEKEVRKIYESLLRGTSSNHQFEFTTLDQMGRELELEAWFRKINYQGEPALQGIFIDKTERKEFFMKEKTYKQILMNEHKLASIGKLAAGIAHNLNTPISVIITNAELLLLKYKNSKELDKIIRQAERMGNIINKLLTKSRQEQLLEPQKIELNKLIEDELEFLSSDLEFKHNVTKDIRLDENIPAIYAVYSDFSQSIMNIIENAIDAMYKRPEKKLSVITKLEDHTILVIIKDTGVGIDRKNFTNLFDPFFTTKSISQERKDNAPSGTGLGLATVHNLLKPYGVQIDVDSTVDVGTTFTLRIPIDNVKKQNIETGR